MPSMLRFRAIPALRPRAGRPERTGASHVHHPRHRCQRVRRKPTSSRPSSTPVIASSRSRGRPRPARSRSGGCRRPSARMSRSGIGDVTRPDSLPAAMTGVDAVVHLVAIPRDFNGGADLRLVNTEGTRAVVVRDAVGRRPAPDPHGRDGRRGRSGPPLREFQGEGRGPRARVRPRLDDPQAIAAVRRGRRVLQHHRRARPDVARDRAGPGRRQVTLPADPRRRRRPDHGRVAGRSDHDRRPPSSSAVRATGPTARSPARSCPRSTRSA